MKKLLYLFLVIAAITSCKKDPCKNVVCYNNGVCDDGTCLCPNGYSGTNCEIQLDPCATVTCYNGGTCVSGICNCPTGYGGTNCQTIVDPCANVTCYNGGWCTSGFCNCPTGYTGTQCQIQQTPQYMRINSITLYNYPTTNSSGSGYDLSSGPDIYMCVDLGTTSLGENSTRQTYYFADCAPGTYYWNSSSGLPIDINNVTSNWVVGAWDVDDFDADDFIGGIYFRPSDFYFTGFPSTINLQTTTMQITLSVSWIF